MAFAALRFVPQRSVQLGSPPIGDSATRLTSAGAQCDERADAIGLPGRFAGSGLAPSVRASRAWLLQCEEGLPRLAIDNLFYR